MKCPKCDGYGIIGDAVPDILRGRGHIFSSNECDRCHGSGEVEQTNEEWLRTATTEQLAEFVIKAMLFYDNAGITVLEAIKNAVEDNEKLGSYFMESVVEWLKQPHSGES